MTSTLILHVRKKYFDQIKAGEKTEEYRLCKPYWVSRIQYSREVLRTVKIIHGYPHTEIEGENVLYFPWNGYEIKTITHENFGPNPVKVYAVRLIRGAK